MNELPSECSSGCESGWTLYLNQASVSADPYSREDGICDEYYKEKRTGEEDEEDLSMVSDASSGPPHFHIDEDHFEDDGSSTFAAFAKKSGKKMKTGQYREQVQHPSSLDDTASSPVFNVSKNKIAFANNQASKENELDFSRGFSATHVKGRSTICKDLSFIKPSLPGRPTSANPVKLFRLSDCLQEMEWK